MLPSISPDSDLLGILNLYFPGNPLPSTNFSHVWSLFVVSSTLSLSLGKLLKAFNWISFYWWDHILRTCTLNSLLTRPFLNTRYLDSYGLIFIRFQATLSSNADRTHLVCIWVVVASVVSSMKRIHIYLRFC